jgi:methyl coenzyme M reductase subunit D
MVLGTPRIDNCQRKCIVDDDKEESATLQLAEIRRLIEDGRIVVRSRAKADAMLHFGYGLERIIATIRQLTIDDFHKTIDRPLNVDFTLDVYRTHLKDVGMTAYIKYGIDDCGRLIVRVLSFKDKEN